MKRIMSVLLAVAMLFALTACGSQSESPTNSNGPSASSGSSGENSGVPEKTVITVWAQGGQEEAPLTKRFAEIEQELGNVEIVFENFPKQEQLDKLTVSQEVGDTPDIVFMDYLQVPYYYTLGMVECIDDRVSDELREDMLPSVIDECSYNGKFYTLAMWDSGLSLWGNKSMLEDAGIRIPTSYTNACDRAKFEDALQKLQNNGIEHPFYMRQNNPSTNYFSYLPVVRSFGGDFMNRDTMLTSGTLDGEKTIEAYEYVSWLVEQGYIDPYVDYDDGFNVRKENALALIGSYQYQVYSAELGDDLIAIPIPDFGGGVYTCSGSGVYFMTTAATQRGVGDLAYKVMEMLMTPEFVSKITDANGCIPGLKSVLEYKEGYQPGETFYLFREQLEAGISYLRPRTPAHMTNYSAVAEALSNIFLGADPATELHKAAESVDAVILENGWDQWID